MADQTTILQSLGRVPANSSLNLTTSRKTWKFLLESSTSGDYLKQPIAIQVWSPSIDWWIGTDMVSAINSVEMVPVLKGEKLVVGVTDGDFLTIRANSTSGLIYAIRVG